MSKHLELIHNNLIYFHAKYNDTEDLEKLNQILQAAKILEKENIAYKLKEENANGIQS